MNASDPPRRSSADTTTGERPATGTFFEPPERAPAAEFNLQCRAVRDEPNMCRMLDLQPEPALVVNEQRQIVFVNQACLELFGVSPSDALGQRIGEALHCIHASEAPAGCGTTKYCVVCGAAKAMREARLERRPASGLCRITRQPDLVPDSLALRVWTTPLVLDGRSFTVVAVRDASDEQRRHVLERVFFHDLLNTSTALKALLMLVSSGVRSPGPAVTAQASRLTEQLVDEIEAHRALLAAERGELVTQPADVPVLPLLEEVAQTYSYRTDVAIRVHPCPASATVTSDRVLLRRILSNLLKNAVEASETGDRIELLFASAAGPAFHVKNPAVMAADVQLQVFQRSFSTKAVYGRGLGTYGSRLIAERYLHARLTFESCAERGTTFTLALPASALVSG